MHRRHLPQHNLTHGGWRARRKPQQFCRALAQPLRDRFEQVGATDHSDQPACLIYHRQPFELAGGHHRGRLRQRRGGRQGDRIASHDISGALRARRQRRYCGRAILQRQRALDINGQISDIARQQVAVGDDANDVTAGIDHRQRPQATVDQ